MSGLNQTLSKTALVALENPTIPDFVFHLRSWQQKMINHHYHNDFILSLTDSHHHHRRQIPIIVEICYGGNAPPGQYDHIRITASICL